MFMVCFYDMLSCLNFRATSRHIAFFPPFLKFTLIKIQRADYSKSFAGAVVVSSKLFKSSS
jgi:hypothetical protein